MVKACEVCGRDDNRIQIRAGTGLCCNLCDKIQKNDISLQGALDYLWSINTAKAEAMYYELGGTVNAKSE